MTNRVCIDLRQQNRLSKCLQRHS